MIHHSFEINNFPYRSATSRLALKVHFEAHTRVATWNDSTSLDTNEAAIDLSDAGDDHKPVVPWNNYVNVTGTGCAATAPVLRSVIWANESIFDVDHLSAAAQDLDGTFTIALIERIVYFSFLTDCSEPTTIFWDPDLGIQYPSGTETSSAITVLPSLLFLIASLLAIMF